MLNNTTKILTQCRKNTHRNGNLQARRLVSDAITVLLPANANLLVQKPQTFICLQIKKNKVINQITLLVTLDTNRKPRLAKHC